MDEIKLKAPATIANLSCGYDILGLCLSEPYDEIQINKTADKNIVLEIIETSFSNISSNPKDNTGGIPALLIKEDLNLNFGFNIKIKKGIPLSGGLGSSAATAAGVTFGINKLLDNILTQDQMINYALEGEKITSNSPHADNIGPCLLGGLILVRQIDPIDIIRLPIGSFYISILHPEIKVNTKMSREILPDTIPLNKAVSQWANISALTYGFTTNNQELIRRSMKDIIVEPVRSKLITGFDKIKQAAIKNGAIGCSISGSGPSLFAISDNNKHAEEITSAMEQEAKSLSLTYDSYTSDINYSGVKSV